MVGPENSIFRKLKSVDRKKMPLTTEIILHFYFPFKVFPENERERERARDRDLHSAPIAISPANIPVAVDRNLAKIAIDSAISPSIAISRKRRGHRTVFSVVVDDFFLGCGLCFSEFVFSFFFSKHQKIFSGKFFEMQPNTWKHYPFPKNMYFLKNVLQQPNTA